METLKSLLSCGVMALVAALAGCGGGGGSDGSGSGSASNAGAEAAADVDIPLTTVSGTVTYDAVPNDSGALVYSATVRKPARGVVIQLRDSMQNVVGSATTDDAGHYVANAPIGVSVTVRAVARLRREGSGASWDTTIVDNTQLGSLYALESGPVVAAQATQKDLHASSGWDGTAYTGARLAAPWAILDTFWNAQQKVLSVAPDTVFPALTVYWSPNNVPTSGQLSLGQIGTTFYAASSIRHMIFVLGKENVDTDEFDASVLAHEWGHYFQAAFSRDDSVGGNHAMGDLLDRRVAFSEGWGNAWSGMALGRSTYTDSYGAAQAQGLSIDLAAGPTGTRAVKGWFNEQSVDQVLWKLHDAQGFASIFNTLTSEAFKSGGPVTSIHSFNAALRAQSPAAGTLFAPLLDAQRINAQADAWGSGETTSGGSTVALPMYQTLTVGGSVRSCVSNRLGAMAGDNKLGNYGFVRFEVPVTGPYNIAVTGGGAATDPDFELYALAGLQVRGESTAPSTETLAITLKAGTHVLAVHDYNNSAANTCFTVGVN